MAKNTCGTNLVGGGTDAQASDHPWLDHVIGRELDLAALLREFDTACDLNQPRFVALVAESGVGKTRLVQQLYHSLRITSDPSAYWAASFPGDHVSLRLDPDFSTHGPADKDGHANIPYLWWAARFPPPSQRNDPSMLSCGLLASASSLLPHLEHVRATQLLSADRSQALDLFIDVIIEFAPTVLEQALPGLGLGKSVWQKMRENKRLRDENARIRAAIASKGAFHEQQSSDLEARVRAGLESLVVAGCTTTSPKKLPVLLVLDDLQWVDQRSVKILGKIITRAMERGWPLLVLATAWPQPWVDTARNTATPLAQLRTQLQQARLPVIERRLARLPHPAEIINCALPGLTPPQRDLLLERMGGDLYALHLWLLNLRSRAKLFLGRDIRAALTPTGEKVLLDLRTPREEVVRARFSEFAPRIREVLGWAGYQGFSFINHLVSSVDQRLRHDDALGDASMNPFDALRQAEDPLHFIESASRSISRFSDPAHYAVVTTDLADAPDMVSSVANATLAELETWIDDGRVDEISWEELAQFLDVARHVLRQSEQDHRNDSTLALKVDVLRELLSPHSVPGTSMLSGPALDVLLTRFHSLSTLPLLLRARWTAALTGRRFSFRSDARGLVERLRVVAFALAEEALVDMATRGDVRSVDALHLAANSGISLTYALFNIWQLLPPEAPEAPDAAITVMDRLEQDLRAETLPRLTTMLQKVDRLDSPVGRLATIVMLHAITHMAEAPSVRIPGQCDH